MSFQAFSNHLLYTGSLFEEDEAETSWAAGVLVYLDGAVRHFSEFTEVVLQIFLTRVPAKTADKHFPEDKKKIRTGRGNVRTLMQEFLRRGSTRQMNWGVGVA